MHRFQRRTLLGAVLCDTPMYRRPHCRCQAWSDLWPCAIPSIGGSRRMRAIMTVISLLFRYSGNPLSGHSLLRMGREKGRARGERAFGLQGLQGDTGFRPHTGVVIVTEVLEHVDPRLDAREGGP